MAKPLKIIGISLSVVVIIIAAALLSIILFFDPNEYKPQISAAVENATGRQLIIEGEIGLSLFPWIGMELGRISLSNAHGFDDSPFARIDSAEVKLRLLPLLKRNVEMKAVSLRGLHLNLQIDARGRTNWNDLTRTKGTETAAATPSSSDINERGGAVGLAALAIGGVEITDANIVFDDRTSNAHYEIKQMNLISGPVSLDKPLDVSLDSLFSSTQPEISGKLNLSTRIIADLLKGEHHRLEKTQLMLDFDSPEFATRGQLKLNSDIDIDLASEEYRLDGLGIEAHLENADLPTGKLNASLRADVDANLKQGTAKVSQLKLSAYDLNINGNLNATRIMTTPEFNGELAIEQFNARQLLQTLGQTLPETADAAVLKEIALNLKLSGTTKTIRIKPLQLQLDDSQLTGWLEADLPADKPMPALRYQLAIDAIDADRYLPPASEDKVGVAPPASAGAAAVSTLPMALLRQLDIDGDLSIGILKVSGLRISEIKTPLKARDGLIRLQPAARLYQGRYQGDMQVDARQDIPVFNLNEALNGIKAGPLLKDLLGDDMVSGTGNINAKLSSRGHTPADMTQALNGDIKIIFTNGSIKDFNLAQMVREAQARLKKQPLPAADNIPGTDFTELSGNFKIINGVVHNNDLATKAPYIRITGEGSADLVKEQLDYMVRAAIVKSAQGEGGAALDELQGITIPIRISGSFSQPKFDLQYDEILKARAKAALESKKAAVKQQLETKKEALEQQLQQKTEQKKDDLQQQTEQKKEELKQQAEDALKNKFKGLFK